ncbi:MAG TPA: NAD(P)H-hydrate dehydratase [Candidatus Acidoferrum sp.]|nr:NAD(P)H-hydrate dehydratase [Candidatus Acidoferrum sp.]
MREVDRLTTERYGVPGLQLMEAAGCAVAETVRRQSAPLRGGRVAVLCGKGNNGGDGFVAARHLKRRRFEPFVCLFGRRNELRGDAATNLARWAEIQGEVIEISDAGSLEKVWRRIVDAPVVVDALLGTGLHGPATGLIAEAIQRINQASRNGTAPRPGCVIAVDIPSGLPSDGEPAEGPVLYAHATATFTAPKIGQLISSNAPCCGQLSVHPIGSPAELVEELGKSSLRWVEPQEFSSLPLVRAADSHKGTFGHALLLAGSVGKSGAAALAGYACLRAGAGLTTVACPDAVLPLIAAAHPEYMTEPLHSTKSGVLALRSLKDGTFTELEEGKAVLAIGPGLGTQKQTQEFIRTVVSQTDLPIVLDADGLNAFAGDGAKLRKRKSKFLCVTPHPGEMARLLGMSTNNVQNDRLKAAKEAAAKWNAYVVLKGFHTVIASPVGKIFVNTTGNPGLAKGGSGDVLTGMLAAFTAQFGTADWLRAIALGVYLHGAAAERRGFRSDLSGMLAHEVCDRIPVARARLLAESRRG